MCEKTKREDKKHKSDPPKNEPLTENEERRSYYYDDAHGYEVFTDEDDEEIEDEN